MADGTEVSIKIVGNNRYIIVSGSGEGYYEFFGSGPTLNAAYEDPLAPGRYLPAGFAERLRSGTRVAAEVSTDVESDSELWPYNADPQSVNDYLTFTPHHQPDLMSVREWFMGNSNGEAQGYPRLMTQWQQNHPCSGMGVISGGSSQYTVVNDYGYDYGPTYFASVGEEGLNKTPDSDWYGQACLYTANDEAYGDRRFIIMVDINSRFYAYPVDGYGDTILFATYAGEKGNVPAELTQSEDCPWPSWVTVHGLGVTDVEGGGSLSDQVERLRPLWSFSNDGTRAACVIGHRDAAWADAYYTSYDPWNTSRPVQEDHPGVVEVAFTIALTGTENGDFTFAVTLRQSIYSDDAEFSPVAVAYALKTMNGVPANVLLMLDYEHYTDNLGCAVSQVAPTEEVTDLYDLTHPNMATIAVIKWQDEEINEWVEVRRWLAWYACYPDVIGDQGTSTILEENKFYPTILDFPEMTDGTITFNHFAYLGQIIALDLRSLSVIVAATVQTQGRIETPDTFQMSYGTDAAAIVAIMFNAEVQRETIGHPLVSPVASEMFDLTSTYPDISSMTRFYPNATLDGVMYNPGIGTAIDDVTYYSTLTIRDGAGNSSSHLVRHASETGLGDFYPALIGFTDPEEIHGPRIFSFFDGRLCVRPGFRWRDSSGLVAGESSFYGYPWGAIQHNRVLTQTMTAINGGPRIVVHPDGSYAYHAGPFAAHVGINAMIDDETSAVLITDDYEQVTLDRIKMAKVIEPFTHRAALAKAFPGAFDPELSTSSYFMNIRRTGDRPEYQFAIDSPALTQEWYGTTAYVPCVVGPLLMLSEKLASRIYTDRAIEIQYYTDAAWTFAPRPFYEGVFYSE